MVSMVCSRAGAVSLPCLREFVWVLRRVYDFTQRDISAAFDALLDVENVVLARPVADAGMTVFNAGGDFAGGLIAFEGSRLGSETFVSFDRKAVFVIAEHGQQAMLLA